MNKFFVCLIFVVACACKKQDPGFPFQQVGIAKEGLTVEEDSLIASLPSRSFAASEILLPDGETVEEFLKRTNPGSLPGWGSRVDSAAGITGDDDSYYAFVSDLMSEAYRLSDVNHTFRPGPEKDVDINGKTYKQPGQVGYGYVYNAEISTTIRKAAGKCLLLLYGVDCSAMTTRMLNKAGMVFDTKYDADGLAREEVLNRAIQISPALQNFKYQYELEPYGFDNIAAGDIIYFAHDKGRVFHIGVALNAKDGSGVWIYQSNGTDESPDCNSYSNADNRGPRSIPFAKMIQTHDKKGNLIWANYRILHLVPKKKVNPLLTGAAWKLVNEQTQVGTPYRKISVLQHVVDGTNAKLLFDQDGNFTISDDDPSDQCGGKFILLNNDTEIKLFGCELFEQNPLKAGISELSANRLTLFFILQLPGYQQFTTLYFQR